MYSLSRFKELGLISPTQFDRLVDFTDLILEWNFRINLTGFKSRDQVEDLLVGESILAGKSLPKKSGCVLDFGSGAGIPGLVWAITQPDLQITSLEIREKKVAFQKEAARTIGLTAEILRGRFPEAVEDRRFDVIVTRAIRFSPKLWTSAAELLNPGGFLVRFVTQPEEEDDWQAIPVSDRTTLLIKPY